MTIEIICPSCNYTKETAEDRVPSGARWATCPRCSHRFELPFYGAPFGFEQSEGGPGPARNTREDSPWERRSELGTCSAIFETFKVVLFSPKILFSKMGVAHGLKEPLAFGLLFGSIGSMFGNFWTFLLIWGGMLSWADKPMGRSSMNLIFLGSMILAPLFAVLSIMIISAIIHVFMRAVRGAGNGFGATFRVVSYSQAPQILGIVPFVGGIVGGLWMLIVQIVGLREMHETSYLKVFIAFLLPLFLVLSAMVVGALSLVLLR